MELPRVPWTRTTGRGWAADGLQDQLFQPLLAVAPAAVAAALTVAAALAPGVGAFASAAVVVSARTGWRRGRR